MKPDNSTTYRKSFIPSKGLIGRTDGTTYEGSVCVTPSTIQLYYKTSMQRTAAHYDVWVRYTKI